MNSAENSFNDKQIVASKSNDIAENLLHALKWIHHYKAQTVVIGLTAGTYNDDPLRKEVLTDIYFLASVGARPVIVHGGAVSTDQYGESTDHNAEQEIAIELNEKLAGEFETIGGRAMTFNFESGTVLHGEVESGATLGQLTSVDRIVVDNLCYAGQTPVIPAMCEGPAAERILLDDFASIPFVASQLAAKAAVIVVDGVELGADNQKVIGLADLDSFALKSGISDQVSSAISQAVEAGVESVQLVDCQASHGLLLQLFSEQRPGIEIRKAI